MLREILIGIIGILLAFGVYEYKEGQITHLEKQLQEATIQAQEVALAQSKKLDEQKAAADKVKQYELAKVSADYQRTINGLLQRTPRPINPPSNPNSPATCTGAQLYREDGEFLAGEAAQAEQVRIERDYYYERYESVRREFAGQGANARLDGTVSNPKPIP